MKISNQKWTRYIPATVALFLIIGAVVWLERPQHALAQCSNREDVSILDISLGTREGECTTIGDLAAPVTVVNAWASWCPFCVHELPDFARVSEEFPEVPILAVNRGEAHAIAEEFITTLDRTGRLIFLFDGSDVLYRTIQGFSMPETIIIDNAGSMLFHKRGVMTEQELRDALEALRENTQPETAHTNEYCLAHGGVCHGEGISM